MREALFSAIMTFVVAASFSAAPMTSARQLNCNKCKAIIFEGQVLQTCPHTSTGGDYCIIDGDECQTVGICM